MRLQPPFVLLEDRLGRGPARLYRQPVGRVRCEAACDVDAALAEVEAALGRGLHAAGALGYALGHALEPRLARGWRATPPAAPLIDLGLFAAVEAVEAGALDAFFADLGPPPPIQDLKPGRDSAAHMAAVARVLQAIAAGELYQANLTFPMRLRYGGDPLRLYGALRVRQPTAHAALVALGPEWTLSASPELFLRVQDGRATCRPMKGTAARGADARSDRAAAAALRADPKERAENVMIVDLMRNDLSRVARPGSVQVPSLLTVETYPDLHALTSTVTAHLQEGVGLRRLLAATFPCGSVVGAPKIAAAELLDRLEDGDRGVYTGAIGAVSPSGDVELNVAIRTLRLSPDGEGGYRGEYGVGGGVVADSNPSAEYEEALLKGRLLADLARDHDLIETLRWSAARGLVRATEHLDRMQASATALSFRFDRRAAEAELAARAHGWMRGGPAERRVRLRLRRSGALAVEDEPLIPDGPGPLRAGIAAARLDAGSPYNRHKTTRRDSYEAASREAGEAGWDEAILLNAAGEVADAARRTVFVEVEGRLLTPPLAAGALPGVLRAELLASGRAVEATLRPADLAGAGALLLGNSLRGLQPAAMASAPGR